MIPDITITQDHDKSKQELLDEIDVLRQKLATHEAEVSSRDDQLDAFSVALRQRDEDYNSLFAQFPLGLHEEDYSEVKTAIDNLRAEGVENLREYFEINPGVLRKLVGTVHITNVNKAMLDITQDQSLEEYLDGEVNVEDWWNDEWAAYYADEFHALASSTRLYEAEIEDTRFGGSVFQIHTIATVVRGYEENWEKVITIFEDITERKANEAALIEAKSAAEQASRAKTDFLSNMSHELRTPLNAILGFTELIEYDGSIGQQHLSSVREINRAGQHLLTLIDEMLDMARIESGKIEITIEPVFVVDIIDESVSWVTDLAEAHGVTIQSDTESLPSLLVLADAIRLKQVFLNLLTNAVKYNQNNGQVEIIFDGEHEGWVRIGVRDDGPGIAKDKIDQVFQPFERLGTESSEVEGTGIGLVITRQLIDLMQGRLTVDSEPGVGSTFWIELPKVHISESNISENPSEIEPGIETTTLTLSTLTPEILVAEDNLVNLELLAAQMEKLNFKAEFAVNGAEALELWQSGNFDMLMTDIRMPVMDGYQLIKKVRSMEAGTGISRPIIVISANAMGDDVNKCFEVGANDVMSKPFKLDELRTIVKKWSFKSVSSPGSGAESVKVPCDDIVDLSMLGEIVGDNQVTQRQVLNAYLDALPKALEGMQTAFARRDPEQLRDQAHKLKSSTRGVAANPLADILEALETAGSQNNWEAAEAAMSRLMPLAESTQEFAEAFCAEISSEDKTDNLFLDDEETIAEIDLSILLVDDDFIMHRVSTLILNDLGINNVHTAMSGSKALELLKQENEIDVVICDLNMPEMDGIEFIRHLSALSFEGSLILTSGEDVRILRTVEKLAIEHDLNMLGVLQKPVTPAKIKEILDVLEQATIEGTVLSTEVYDVEELSQAIREDQLDTYFQAKVDVKTGEVVGAEALVRWIHPSQGIVRPYSFITLAEEHKLITKLTEKVCTKALEHAAKIKSHGYDLGIAMNISVDTLNDLSWPDKIVSQIETTGLHPSRITFEITESRLMEDIAVALDILSRLSLKRLNLAIDDFGTGYSSMEQLQRIPFSELKIDRAFVKGAAADPSARAILESSIQLARKLDMKVVAEGVESRQDWDLIAELGCDQVQGYFIGRPMPIDQFIEWLDQWNIKNHLEATRIQ